MMHPPGPGRLPGFQGQQAPQLRLTCPVPHSCPRLCSPVGLRADPPWQRPGSWARRSSPWGPLPASSLGARPSLTPGWLGSRSRPPGLSTWSAFPCLLSPRPPCPTLASKYEGPAGAGPGAQWWVGGEDRGYVLGRPEQTPAWAGVWVWAEAKASPVAAALTRPSAGAGGPRPTGWLESPEAA